MSKLKYLSLVGILSYGCGDKIDKPLPAQVDYNPEYDHRLESVERKIESNKEDLALSHASRELTVESLKQHNEYLSALNANINSTRPQDLPEWQWMYNVITDEDALKEETYTRDGDSRPNNFYRNKVELNKHETAIQALQKNVTENNAQLATKQRVLEEQHKEMMTNRETMKFLTEQFDNRLAKADEVLQKFDERIVAVEARMAAINATFLSFEGRINVMSERVKRIDDLLRRYDLQVMSRRILENRESINENTSEIDKAKTRIRYNEEKISDLYEKEKTLSLITSDIRAKIDPLRVRLDLLQEDLKRVAEATGESNTIGERLGTLENIFAELQENFTALQVDVDHLYERGTNVPEEGQPEDEESDTH